MSPVTTTSKGNKERLTEIVRRTGLCGYCPRHDIENRGRRKKPDRYKNHRRNAKCPSI